MVKCTYIFRRTPTPPQEKALDELVLQQPLDDVWIMKYYARQYYSLSDVINMHREACHPSMLDHPQAVILANIELDMTTKKKV